MMLAVLATAYCLTGTMATGGTTHHGAIAVDPRVIPLGTRLLVPGYGRGRALDTGSAIRGFHIDLWMSSCFAARMWGARHIRIRVLR
jgi:3D (Asp-Asp-Asp) domain-containing protein